MKTITFTGLEYKEQICSDFPSNSNVYGLNIEYGILVHSTKTLVGGKFRYPTFENIDNLLVEKEKKKFDADFALHVCGSWAFSLIDGKIEYTKELINIITNENIKRIQFNFSKNLLLKETQLIDSICRCLDIGLFKNKRIIIPIKKEIDLEVVDNIGEKIGKKIDILFDQSGGNGISPEKWNGVPQEKLERFGKIGYAGGLGPENIFPELTKISQNHFDTIDMETKIRTESDYIMDYKKCQKCVSEFIRWEKQKDKIGSISQ